MQFFDSLSLDYYLSFFASPLGIGAFIIFYALWVTFLLPGLWPSMLGGALYGFYLGSIYVFIGAFIGAQLTFFLGRKLFSNWFKNKISKFPKLIAIEKAVTREGLKLILISRLSPVFPFALLNVMYGVSEVKKIDFTIGLLGIIPGTILYSNLGALAGKASHFNQVLESQSNPQTIISSTISVLATFAIVWLVGKASRKALKEIDEI